jgi:hypothetical protein
MPPCLSSHAVYIFSLCLLLSLSFLSFCLFKDPLLLVYFLFFRPHFSFLFPFSSNPTEYDMRGKAKTAPLIGSVIVLIDIPCNILASSS